MTTGDQALLFSLLEFCTISLAVAATARSSVRARFGVAFHGLFSSLVLFIYTSAAAASVSLLASSVAVPILLSKTTGINSRNVSGRRTITVVAVVALVPVIAITGELYSWHIHAGIQFLLSIFVLKHSGIKAGNTIAFSGLGQASSLAITLMKAFPGSVPFMIVLVEIVLPLVIMQIYRS
ncbi:MAG: hypothetical protein V1857_07305 [archaeon]